MAITYSVQVGWSAQGLTNITSFNSRTTTAYDDISNDVKSYSWHRGRATPDDNINAGTCTVTLVDTTGKYNVFNNNGPLFNYLLPMRTLYIRASPDNGTTWYDQFFGFIRSITFDPYNYTSKIEAIDGFIYLESVIPTIITLSSTSTGAAITAILNASITTTYDSIIATGDSIPSFSSDGTATSLSKINDLLTTALGTFYVNGSGKFIYADRYAPNKSPHNTVQQTLINEVTNISPSITLDNVKNGAHVTMSGSTQQNWSDTTSQNKYGRIDIPSIISPYLASDAQALNLAQYLVAIHKNAIGQTKFADLNAGTTTNVQTAILTRDLTDHINIQDTKAQLNNDYDIVGITQDVTFGGEHRATWILYTRNIYGLPLIFNQSTAGNTDVFVY